MKKIIYTFVGVISAFFLFTNCSGSGFEGTYVGDLTIMQSGNKTTIELTSDHTAIFKDDGYSSYKTESWFPAEAGGGIKFSGYGDESCYYMDKDKTHMYWGFSNYMNKTNGYKIKKIK